MVNNGVKKKLDRRVVKSKRAIRNAFITLLTQKDINDITITDIADVADVDRKTVYNYYNGVYDILDEFEDELITLLEEATKELDFEKNIKNPQHIFEILTDIINSNFDLYSNLMKIDNNSQIVRKIVMSLEYQVRLALKKNIVKDSKKVDVLSEFITFGMLSVYQNWFNSSDRQPLEEFSKEVGDIVLYGVKGYVDKNKLK